MSDIPWDTIFVATLLMVVGVLDFVVFDDIPLLKINTSSLMKSPLFS